MVHFRILQGKLCDFEYPIIDTTDVHIHWDEHSDLHKYIVSLYWAVTTISSVG